MNKNRKSAGRQQQKYHQQQLKQLEAVAGDRIDDLLRYFGYIDDLRRAKRFYVGKCPIHNGDNNSAFNIFHSGDEMVGNWRCFTHNCHTHFQPTIIGFVRGVLSRTKYGWFNESDTDKECSFKEAVEFLTKFCDQKDITKLDIDHDKFEQRKFVSQMNIYQESEPPIERQIEKELVHSSLDIPASYFISRGYTPEILKKYNVGLCTNPKKEMFMRAVVPIYDDNYEYIIGCTGRSIWDICKICKHYHSPIKECPDKYNIWKYTKWRHSYGFKGEFHLYNYWFAKEHIRKTGIMVLTESPGNVWRLEEAGIHNSVGSYGAHFTDGQRVILDKSGALAVIVLTDDDQAGRLCNEVIRKELEKTYQLYFPNLEGDIDKMSVQTLNKDLVPIINEIQRKIGL